jgi:hypothetical protein
MDFESKFDDTNQSFCVFKEITYNHVILFFGPFVP